MQGGHRRSVQVIIMISAHIHVSSCEHGNLRLGKSCRSSLRSGASLTRPEVHAGGPKACFHHLKHVLTSSPVLLLLSKCCPD
jgi:hypothetical protein